MISGKFINKQSNRFLSAEIKQNSERFILVVAIASYIGHLLLIFLSNIGVLSIDSKFFQNPIAAIYTPFSFILIYEVFLLIFFLPRSISSYIGKQYEIITLIVIRRIFKDLANLELSSDWFQIKDDLQFTYDVITSLVLFALIFLFYKIIKLRTSTNAGNRITDDNDISRFITIKKGIALLLIPLLLGLALFTLFNWSIDVFNNYQYGLKDFKNLNNIFFEEFFTVLIIVDVFLLLISFFHSDKFHIIIRNSGFIISTILIKLSFSVEGIVNNTLIVGAVLFGLLMLIIHNLFEQDINHNKPDLKG